jgi:hypothetical protein
VNWRTKARLQKTLSWLPAGYRLNYLLQRYVTHSLPRPVDELRAIIATAERHLAAISTSLDKPIDEVRFFEFGAGYDLAEPLAASSMGVADRLLYDIRPVARRSMVLTTAEALRVLGMDLPNTDHHRCPRRVPGRVGPALCRPRRRAGHWSGAGLDRCVHHHQRPRAHRP